jgi:hypothetical protein
MLPWQTAFAMSLSFTLLLPLWGIFAMAGLVIFVLGRTNWVISPAERHTLDQSLLPVLNRFGIPLQSLWPVAKQA